MGCRQMCWRRPDSLNTLRFLTCSSFARPWAKFPQKSKAPRPDLPWKSIVNLRNIIVHSYWQIDLEIIAAVIENDLDPLVAELTKLITFIERTDK